MPAVAVAAAAVVVDPAAVVPMGGYHGGGRLVGERPYGMSGRSAGAGTKSAGRTCGRCGYKAASYTWWSSPRDR